MGVPEQDFPGMSSVTGADPGGVFSSGDIADRRQDLIGGAGAADDEHPSFAGAVEGIQSQHIAGGFYGGSTGRADPSSSMEKGVPSVNSFSVVANAASGWIAQHADVRPGSIKCGGADLMERGTVGA